MTEHGSHQGDSVVVDCDRCVVRGPSACGDCIVTFVCDGDHHQQHALVFDLSEVRAVRLLTSAGLVPALRHQALG